MADKARRMARLSARIFGEVVRQTTPQDYKVVKIYSRFRYKPALPSWYPPLPIYQSLLLRLRRLGLFTDEHEDFREEMKRKRIDRGKGTPRKGEGKRSKKKGRR